MAAASARLDAGKPTGEVESRSIRTSASPCRNVRVRVRIGIRISIRISMDICIMISTSIRSTRFKYTYKYNYKYKQLGTYE